MIVVILLIALIFDLILCKLVADAWHNRGLSSNSGFWVSFFFTPLIGILLGMMQSGNKIANESAVPLSTKKCPACAEVIKKEAIICRFCGQQFDLADNVFEEKGIAFNNDSFLSAVQEGNKEIVELFINNGIDVNARGYNDQTALMLASEKGHIDIVKTLILNGADVNLKTRAGWTAMMSARGKSEIEDLLRPSGASKNKPPKFKTKEEYEQWKKKRLEKYEDTKE